MAGKRPLCEGLSSFLRRTLPDDKGGLTVSSNETNEPLWTALKAGLHSDTWLVLLGIEVENISHGLARLRLRLSETISRPATGEIREGALAALMEAAVGAAVDSLDLPELRSKTIVSIAMSILGTAKEDVVAEARVIQFGPAGAKVETELRDPPGVLVAKGITVCAASLD